MDKTQIISDLKERQKELSKQLQETSEDAEQGGDEEAVWDAEVGAKLNLVEELLELYTKPKRKK
jgi:hypothetical protein